MGNYTKDSEIYYYVIGSEKPLKQEYNKDFYLLGELDVGIVEAENTHKGSYIFLKRTSSLPNIYDKAQISMWDAGDARFASRFLFHVFEDHDYRNVEGLQEHLIKTIIEEKLSHLDFKIEDFQKKSELFERSIENNLEKIKKTTDGLVTIQESFFSEFVISNKMMKNFVSTSVSNVSFQIIECEDKNLFLNAKGVFNPELFVSKYYEQQGFKVNKLTGRYDGLWFKFFKDKKGVPDFLCTMNGNKFFVEVKFGIDGLRFDQMKQMFDNPNYSFIVCWVKIKSKIIKSLPGQKPL